MRNEPAIDRLKPLRLHVLASAWAAWLWPALAISLLLSCGHQPAAEKRESEPQRAAEKRESARFPYPCSSRGAPVPHDAERARAAFDHRAVTHDLFVSAAAGVVLRAADGAIERRALDDGRVLTSVDAPAGEILRATADGALVWTREARGKRRLARLSFSGDPLQLSPLLPLPAWVESGAPFGSDDDIVAWSEGDGDIVVDWTAYDLWRAGVRGPDDDAQTDCGSIRIRGDVVTEGGYIDVPVVMPPRVAHVSGTRSWLLDGDARVIEELEDPPGSGRFSLEDRDGAVVPLALSPSLTNAGAEAVVGVHRGVVLVLFAERVAHTPTGGGVPLRQREMVAVDTASGAVRYSISLTPVEEVAGPP